MAGHNEMTTKAVNYIEMEYPSLIKYKYKMAIIIYANKDNIREDVSIQDLINVMCMIMNKYLRREVNNGQI